MKIKVKHVKQKVMALIVLLTTLIFAGLLMECDAAFVIAWNAIFGLWVLFSRENLLGDVDNCTLEISIARKDERL